MIVEVDGKAQLVGNSAQVTIGHDPRTGKELWRAVYGDANSISPIVNGYGLVFINIGGTPHRVRLWAVRQDGAGDVTFLQRSSGDILQCVLFKFGYMFYVPGST